MEHYTKIICQMVNYCNKLFSYGLSGLVRYFITVTCRIAGLDSDGQTVGVVIYTANFALEGNQYSSYTLAKTSAKPISVKFSVVRPKNQYYIINKLVKFKESTTLTPKNRSNYRNKASAFDRLASKHFSNVSYPKTVINPEEIISLVPSKNVYIESNIQTLNPLGVHEEETIKAADKALSCDHNYEGAKIYRAPILHGMGDKHLRVEKYQEALDQFEEAITLVPRAKVFTSDKAQVVKELDPYREEAIKAADKALSYDPNYEGAKIYRAPVLHGIGDKHLRVEKYQEALDQFEEAITLAPRAKVFTSDKAQVVKELDPYREEAIKAADKALSYDPNYEGAKIYRAPVLHGIGDKHLRVEKYQETLDQFEEAITLVPADKAYYSNKANALNGLGWYADGTTALGRALGYDPDYQLAKSAKVVAFSEIQHEATGQTLIMQPLFDFLVVLEPSSQPSSSVSSCFNPISSRPASRGDYLSSLLTGVDFIILALRASKTILLQLPEQTPVGETVIWSFSLSALKLNSPVVSTSSFSAISSSISTGIDGAIPWHKDFWKTHYSWLCCIRFPSSTGVIDLSISSYQQAEYRFPEGNVKLIGIVDMVTPYLPFLGIDAAILTLRASKAILLQLPEQTPVGETVIWSFSLSALKSNSSVISTSSFSASSSSISTSIDGAIPRHKDFWKTHYSWLSPIRCHPPTGVIDLSISSYQQPESRFPEGNVKLIGIVDSIYHVKLGDCVTMLKHVVLVVLARWWQEDPALKICEDTVGEEPADCVTSSLSLANHFEEEIGCFVLGESSSIEVS